MRRVVTIDIETLPIASDPNPIGGSADDKAAEAYRKTALSGDFGRILCIGFSDEIRGELVAEDVIGWDETTQSFPVDEKAALEQFWRRMCGFRPSLDRIVGHNVFDFDLKFILKRSVIHGVRPTVDLSFARYRNQPIFDTMYEWERWSFGSKISLDRLAKVLNLQSSKANGVDGSHVHELFMAGNHQAIRDYCAADVALTREIYRRLVFAEGASPRILGAERSEGLSALVG